MPKTPPIIELLEKIAAFVYYTFGQPFVSFLSNILTTVGSPTLFMVALLMVFVGRELGKKNVPKPRQKLYRHDRPPNLGNWFGRPPGPPPNRSEKASINNPKKPLSGKNSKGAKKAMPKSKKPQNKKGNKRK